MIAGPSASAVEGDEALMTRRRLPPTSRAFVEFVRAEGRGQDRG